MSYKTTLIGVLCLLCFSSNSQSLSVSVGEDDTICASAISDTLYSMVFGGTQPYSYTWTVFPLPSSSNGFSSVASEVLNDTSSATPHLQGTVDFESWERTFILSVEDNTGATVNDTITLYHGGNYATSLIEQPHFVNLGDTVSFNSLAQYSRVPFSIVDWSANSGMITDPIDTINPVTGLANQMAVHWTLGYSTYSCVITDVLGCEFPGSSVDVFVAFPQSTRDFKGLTKLKAYPNPTEDIAYIELPALGLASYRVFSVNGTLVGQSKSGVMGKTIEVDLASLNPGIYFCVIQVDEMTYHSQVVVK